MHFICITKIEEEEDQKYIHKYTWGYDEYNFNDYSYV